MSSEMSVQDNKIRSRPEDLNEYNNMDRGNLRVQERFILEMIKSPGQQHTIMVS